MLTPKQVAAFDTLPKLKQYLKTNNARALQSVGAVNAHVGTGRLEYCYKSQNISIQVGNGILREVLTEREWLNMVAGRAHGADFSKYSECARGAAIEFGKYIAPPYAGPDRQRLDGTYYDPLVLADYNSSTSSFGGNIFGPAYAALDGGFHFDAKAALPCTVSACNTSDGRRNRLCALGLTHRMEKLGFDAACCEAGILATEIGGIMVPYRHNDLIVMHGHYQHGPVNTFPRPEYRKSSGHPQTERSSIVSLYKVPKERMTMEGRIEPAVMM